MSDQKTPTPPPPPTLPVDQQWLEKLANEKYGANGEIASVSCEIIGEGKGFLSVMTKATIEWKGSDVKKLPKAVVFKLPTYEKIKQVPMMAELLPESLLAKVHNNEVRAYEFFNMYPPSPFPMAKLLFTENREDEKNGMLILEAIEGRSPTFNDDYTLDQVNALLDAVASVQAYGFLHKESEEYIGDMPMNSFSQMIAGTMEKAAKLRENYPDVFTLTDVKIEAALAKANELIPLIMEKEKLQEKYHPVVCFGDMQPNNTLWKLNPDGSISNEDRKSVV